MLPSMVIWPLRLLFQLTILDNEFTSTNCKVPKILIFFSCFHNHQINTSYVSKPTIVKMYHIHLSQIIKIGAEIIKEMLCSLVGPFPLELEVHKNVKPQNRKNKAY